MFPIHEFKDEKNRLLPCTPSLNRFAYGPREFLPIANAHSNQLTSPKINKHYREEAFDNYLIQHLEKRVVEMKHSVQVLKVVFLWGFSLSRKIVCFFPRNTENVRMKASDSTDVFFLS